MNILPMILKPIILKFPPANIEPNNCGILAFVKNNFLQFQKTNPYQLHWDKLFSPCIKRLSKGFKSPIPSQMIRIHPVIRLFFGPH